MFWRSWLPTSAMRSRTFCQLKLEYSFPSTHIRPDDGVLYAHNVEINDVLPAPFAPKRTHLCPSSTFHVMESMIGLSATKDKFSNSKILFIFLLFAVLFSLFIKIIGKWTGGISPILRKLRQLFVMGNSRFSCDDKWNNLKKWARLYWHPRLRGAAFF